MALAQFIGGGVVSKSAGGLTAQGSKGGTMLRARSRTRQNRTTALMIAQNQFGSANNAWTNSLEPSDRANWDQFAAQNPTFFMMGKKRTMSGQAWYIQYSSWNALFFAQGFPLLNPIGTSLKTWPFSIIQSSSFYQPIGGGSFEVMGTIPEITGANDSAITYISQPTPRGQPKISKLGAPAIYTPVTPGIPANTPLSIVNIDPFGAQRVVGEIVMVGIVYLTNSSPSNMQTVTVIVP